MLHASRENSSMKVHTVCATLVATLGATLALVSTVAHAAKPAPPPPPLPAQTCAGSPGVFPAFAYHKDKTTTVKKFGGTVVWDGSDLYIANSTGSCSIPIHLGTRASSARGVSYRQIGTEARIAWAQGSEIRLLKFHVVNGSVVEPRPITPSIVYVLNQTPSGIGGVDLSRDGQTIYYPDEIGTVDGRWISSVNLISIATCTSNCSSQRIYTFEDDNGVGGVEINDSDDRLYMSIHDRVPDIRTVSFLEKQGGSWTSPLLRHVVSNQDAEYVSVSGFATTAVGKWDYDNSSVLSDVLSFVVERPSGDTTDIIDVSNCSSSGVSSCLSSGESCVVRTGIAGSGQSFTSTPSSPMDDGPNLLVVGGGWIGDVDLDDFEAAPVWFREGGGVESAD